MKILISGFGILLFCFVVTINCTYANDKSWGYKDWRVTTNDKFVIYDTNGITVHANVFGFIKGNNDCNTDQLAIFWPAYKDGIEDFETSDVTIKLRIGKTQFKIKTTLAVVTNLAPSKNVIAFSNFVAGERLISLLKKEDNIEVSIVAPEELVAKLDVTTDTFSLKGYTATLLKAKEFCGSSNVAPKLVNSEDEKKKFNKSKAIKKEAYKIDHPDCKPNNIDPTSISSINKIWADPITGMEFIFVPGGCYQMGSSADDSDKNEKPIHNVCVDGFWIGKYEVTQGQWKKIMDSNPSYFKSGDNFPVDNVSWDDTQRFINKLGKQSNNTFRLPTEAQWEYAARSGGKDEKYSGGNNVDSVAWSASSKISSPHTVGTKAANGLGIYDMSGNVAEWCEDVYDSKAYSKHPQNNPLVTSSSDCYRKRKRAALNMGVNLNRDYYRMKFVLRGGRWNLSPNLVRCTNRSSLTPTSTFGTPGLRLVRIETEKQNESQEPMIYDNGWKELTKTELAERIQRPVLNINKGEPFDFKVVDKNGSEVGRVNTSAEYYEQRLKGNNLYAHTTYDEIDRGIFRGVAMPLRYLSKAKPSKHSYVKNFPFAKDPLSILPVDFISWRGSDQEAVVEKASKEKKPWRYLAPNARILTSTSSDLRIHDTFGEDMYDLPKEERYAGDQASHIMSPVVLGDLNNDGYEDIVLDCAHYNVGGSGRSYYYKVLTRTTPNAILEDITNEVDKLIWKEPVRFNSTSTLKSVDALKKANQIKEEIVINAASNIESQGSDNSKSDQKSDHMIIDKFGDWSVRHVFDQKTLEYKYSDAKTALEMKDGRKVEFQINRRTGDDWITYILNGWLDKVIIRASGREFTATQSSMHTFYGEADIDLLNAIANSNQRIEIEAIQDGVSYIGSISSKGSSAALRWIRVIK